MSTKWIELKTGKEVFDRDAEGWEIEICKDAATDLWVRWGGKCWYESAKYHGRPPQPKTKTVTSECWRNGCNGNLAWTNPEYQKADGWQRFPAGDITGEVSDEY
jgi:hypothetical protein